MASSSLRFLLLFVCVCFLLLITCSYHSLCVSFLTSSLFLMGFGFLSPLSPFYMPVISSPLTTQNEGCPFSCPLGSHSSLNISEQSHHLQIQAMALSHFSPTMGALRAGQRGLGQVPTCHREAARPRRGSVSLAIRPSRSCHRLAVGSGASHLTSA